VQALLPPDLGRSLAMLDGNRLSVALGNLDVQQDASGNVTAGLDSLVTSAAINFVDKQGAVYLCPDALMSIFGAKVELGSDRKPKHIEAAGMNASGHFTKKGRNGATVSGNATLKTGNVKITMGAGGAPASVVASDIEASGALDTTPGADDAANATGPVEPSRQDKLDKLRRTEASAVEGARMLKRADVHTQTPVHAGRYGGFFHIGVAPGTHLDVNIVIRDNALTGATDVEIHPALDLPAWFAARGLNLEVKGKEGMLETDIKGFFDLNVSKYVGGHKTIPLDVTALIRQVMDHMQESIANAKEPARPSTSQVERETRDQQEDARDLAEKHAGWERDRTEHQADARSAADRKRAADEDAGREPMGGSMSDVVKGIDVGATHGTADLELTTGGTPATVEGVTMAAGNDVHLHGSASGGGQFRLTVDEATAQVGDSQVQATGLDTGNVSVRSGDSGTHIAFDSFSLKQLRWDALPKKS
jgi:hypothetical protein